jgi:AcrR family transcriptional regulator
MSRWEPNTKQRLKQVAMDLFDKRGFEETTVADIATHAGLNERTFFRYFADKREVLFDGRSVLEDAYSNSIAASHSSAPLQMVSDSLIVVGEFMESQRGRATAARRQRIIMANPELQERELLKMNHLSVVISDALQKRGVDRTTANLAADIATTVFKNAFIEWVRSDDSHSLNDHIQDLLTQFRVIAVE